MQNLFNFEYQVNQIMNSDGTPSRFSYVYGSQGKVIHTKKDSYEIIKTQDVAHLGEAFMKEGYNVTPFTHKHGEVIGLKIDLGEKPSVVGGKLMEVIIKVPNNGGGVGHLSIHETRLICTNGLSRKVSGKEGLVKIPHNLTYHQAIDVMRSSVKAFDLLVDSAEQTDKKLNDSEISYVEALVALNKWFYTNEVSESLKKDITLDDFRRITVTGELEDYKFEARYNALMDAFTKEQGFNANLDLQLSKYTVLATVTNYLSRQVEKSKSSAHEVIQFERKSSKLAELLKA